MRRSLTIYPQTEDALRGTLSCADIDEESLRRPLRRCDIGVCKGMCCYDGVYLNEEEESKITELWRSEAPFFAAHGLDTTLPPVVDGSWGGRTGRKTRVLPRPFSQTVANFPAFFNDTACVFLDSVGRCTLQLLGVARAKHPWYFKPITCALHPLSVSLKNREVRLYSEHDDRHRDGAYVGYASQTQCGATCHAGRPAFEVLAEELRFLRELLA